MKITNMGNGGSHSIPGPILLFLGYICLKRKEKKMKVLVIEPGKTPYQKEVVGLEEMQQVVGGYIEVCYPFEDLVAIVCNEEGKILRLPLNRAIRNEQGDLINIIAGTFFICGLSDEGFKSLSPKLMEKYRKMFYAPEVFIDTGKKNAGKSRRMHRVGL